MPYRSRIANALELAASLSIIYATSLLTWFADSADGEHDKTVSVAAGIISFFPLLVTCVCISQVLWVAAKITRYPADHQKKVKKDVDALKIMGEALALISDDAKNAMLQRMDEWDRYQLLQASEMFALAALGKRGKSRVVRKSL